MRLSDRFSSGPPTCRPPDMYRDAATTSAPPRASATIGSTTCGSSEPSAIEIST